MLAVEIATVGSLVAPILAACAALYAGIAAHRTERKGQQVEERAAGRQETQQSFDFQSKTLDRADKRIEILETEISEMRARMDRVIDNHRSCEERLAVAESRIRALVDQLEAIARSQVVANTKVLTTVVDDLAASHARADATPIGDPGSAADAASKT